MQKNEKMNEWKCEWKWMNENEWEKAWLIKQCTEYILFYPIFRKAPPSSGCLKLRLSETGTLRFKFKFLHAPFCVQKRAGAGTQWCAKGCAENAEWILQRDEPKFRSWMRMNITRKCEWIYSWIRNISKNVNKHIFGCESICWE